MQRRILAVMIAVATVAACAGCTAPPQAAPPAATTEPGGTPSGQAEPSEPDVPAEPVEPAVSVQELVVTIDELPTGGWAAVPTDAPSGVSSDSASADACTLDLAGLLPEPAPEEQGRAMFVRESLGQQLIMGVVAVDDPGAVIETVEAAWSDCPERTDFVRNGQDASTLLSPYEGAVAGDATCRHFQLTAGSSGATGDMCLVAAEGYVSVATTTAQYAHQAVEPAELDQILEAQGALLE